MDLIDTLEPPLNDVIRIESTHPVGKYILEKRTMLREYYERAPIR
jgi:hypothetical protein